MTGTTIMAIGKLQLTILLGCLLVLLITPEGEALVIGAPRIGGNRFFPPTTAAQDEEITDKDVAIRIRIRSTREEDIDQVASLLSYAIVDPPTSKNSNSNGAAAVAAAAAFHWKSSIDLLRTKVAVESLLRSRIQAMREGQRFLSAGGIAASSSDDLTTTTWRTTASSDRLRLLWSNDAFRNKMEKAAKLSTEPHIWGEHNFALVPNDPCWLQHKMFTAQDARSGEIVAFCEVAMLSVPSDHDHGNIHDNIDHNDDEEECCSSMNGAPTIVNLVTSSQHRRRGIGSRLLKTAERFVLNQWSSSSSSAAAAAAAADELALYVDKGNKEAISVYTNMGFEKVQSVESETRGSQWYMRRKLTAAGGGGESQSSSSSPQQNEQEAVLVVLSESSSSSCSSSTPPPF
jgi:ribosomal protein S18 acetylase RimI-like enzyme